VLHSKGALLVGEREGDGVVGVFFLRKPKRRPAESTALLPEADFQAEQGRRYPPLAVAPRIEYLPDGLPGEPDLYAILGVDPLSSDEVIRYAYRRRAARLHERRWRPAQAVRQLAELNAAYEILGKPDRRADYDTRRVRRAALEQALDGGESADDLLAYGRVLPSGQRREGPRLRIGAAGGLVEVVVILMVIGLALYAALSVLSAGSLIDLSKVVELSENFGLTSRRRVATTPSATAAPVLTAVPSQNAPSATLVPTPAAASGPSAAAAPKPSATGFAGSLAQVSNPAPPRRSEVSVIVQVLRDGLPVPGAQVFAVVHFKTLDERWPAGAGTQSTDANGSATISFNIGDATPGFAVNVDLIALVEGEQLQLQTSFTPR